MAGRFAMASSRFSVRFFLNLCGRGVLTPRVYHVDHYASQGEGTLPTHYKRKENVGLKPAQ